MSAFFLLSQPCLCCSEPWHRGPPTWAGTPEHLYIGQGSGTKYNSSLTAQDLQVEVRMQSPPLGSRNRFTCLSGQVQGSRDGGHGLGQGLQGRGKGLPLPTEKSLIPLWQGLVSQPQASILLWNTGSEAQDLQFHGTQHGGGDGGHDGQTRISG